MLARVRRWFEPAPESAAVREALGAMESLGENCEFGAVQKAAGLDGMGLFRWASTTPLGVKRLVDRNFEGLDVFDELDTFAGPQNEVYLRHRGYEFFCHCFTHPGSDWRAHREIERRRISLLVRKLREDLTTGRKIFVFKSRTPIDPAVARGLAASLRRHGPNDLLWVIEAARPGDVGRVRWLEAGLMQGAVDRFAPDAAALEVSFDAWSRVAVAAARLHAEGALAHLKPRAAVRIGRGHAAARIA